VGSAKLSVACSSSPEYLPHAATMLRSVLAQADGLQLEVNLMHGPHVAAENVARVGAMVEGAGGSFRAHRISEDRIAGLPPVRHAGLPATIWYRIHLPQLLPDADRVLYLDVDLIAVDSIAPLADVDLGDHYVAAVTNVWEPWNEGYPAQLGMHLKGPRSYFNSGVILMNLELMRRDDCTRALREWALAREKLPWGDQDALNAVLGHRRIELHPRWNCMNSVLLFPQAADVFGADAVAEARAHPAIRHFEGPGANKPWHLLADREGRAAYLRQRRQTPWPRQLPEGITPRNVVRLLGRRVRRR
jgi:lipopolysaccharide biosynthesis glycosyltransferase